MSPALQKLTAFLPGSLLTLAALFSLTAHGQSSRIDGRLIIDLRYTESDVLTSDAKDSQGETKRHAATETAIQIHESHSIQITKDTEGESFLVMEDPQKSLQGSATYTYHAKDSHSAVPDGKDYPPATTESHGSAGGIADPTQVGGANINHIGDGVDLMATIPALIKITRSNCQNKTTLHHWEGLPPNRHLVTDRHTDTINPLPGEGQTDSPGFTLRPTPTSATEGPQPDPAEDFSSNVWYGAKTTKLAKGGYTLTCSGTIEDPAAKAESQASTPGKSVSHTHRKTISATITIIPGPKPPQDLIIEPVDSLAYDNWVPKPVCETADAQKLYGDPDRLSFKATLKPKDPKKPAAGAPMDFYLTEVSKNTGRCGNEPKTGYAGDPKPGLRFAKDQADGIHVDPGNPQHAYIVKDVTEAVIVVEAIDAAAYGRLEATADTSDLVGTYPRTSEKFIPIPRDDNNNHIADAWEKQNHIFDQNLAATWDEENKPDTGDSHKGDGFTLYEEYRGFATLVNLDDQNQQLWQRLQPGVKKIFVYAQGDDNRLFRTGARLYEAIEGTKVYFIFDDDGLAKDDLGTAPYVKRWVNFNSTTNDGVHFQGRQFAINILGDNEAKIFTKSAPNDYYTDIKSRCPEDVEAIHISHPYVVRTIDGFIHCLPPSLNPIVFPVDPSRPLPPHSISLVWGEADVSLRAKGIDVHFADIATRMQANKEKLINQYITFSVMHELGHATGAKHHGLAQALQDDQKVEDKYYSAGDVDCAMRYWDTDERMPVDNFEIRLRFFAGLWDPSLNAPDGAPWHFCDKNDCRPIMHLIKKD